MPPLGRFNFVMNGCGKRAKSEPRAQGLPGAVSRRQKAESRKWKAESSSRKRRSIRLLKTALNAVIPYLCLSFQALVKNPRIGARVFRGAYKEGKILRFSLAALAY